MREETFDWVESPVSKRLLRRGGEEMANGSGRGVYTPMAMERVRKRLKGNGLQASIVRKSPEAVGNKGVE
jgi:hypothetical protein